jgi:4-hydroxy-3-methylbut-2-en-1-yl diphosphate synthase (EC 1.17.4.3)
MVRDLQIGGGAPISVQSMTATRTQDIEATLTQIRALETAGADLIRIAIDNKKDLEALVEIRKETRARLVVDLQKITHWQSSCASCRQIRYNPRPPFTT